MLTCATQAIEFKQMAALDKDDLQDDVLLESMPFALHDVEQVCPIDIPNITMQATAKDTQALGSGIDRIVAATVSEIDTPPLCRSWVRLSCNKGSLNCKGRHYFVSMAERDRWVARRERRERALDMRVLRCVLARETLLEELYTAAQQAKMKYLDDSGNDSTQPAGSTQHALLSAVSVTKPVLALLDQLRVSGVNCVESLTAWREYHVRQRRILADTARPVTANGHIWIATIESEGRQLWGPIPAVFSQFKKYQRGILPAKRARITKFLGVYTTREAAIQAYEAAKPRVAMERRVLLKDLPPRAERETFGGLNIVETRGSKSLTTLEHAVRSRAQADDPPPPAYFYDGENYLLKMTKDLNWLASLAPLRVCVGPGFPLVNNPFMLTNELRETLGCHASVPSLSLPTSSLQNRAFLSTIQTTRDDIMSGPPAGRFLGPQDTCSATSKFECVRDSLPRKSFGTPSDVVRRHNLGSFVSWQGEMRLGSHFHVGDDSKTVCVLDIVRVIRAATSLEEETRAYMWHAGLSEADSVRSEGESDDMSDSIENQSETCEGTDLPGRQVWAQYEELQAKLVVQQSRKSPNGVLKGIFCRAEKGKWKGVGIPGPATRTYWFKRRLREEAERRRAKRDLIASRLRKETSRGLVRMRPSKMVSLLERASDLRGAGRIAVDAHRAKLLLERRYSGEICAAILERYNRGIRGRKSARKHKRILGSSLDARNCRRDMCLEVAKSVVNFALNAASLQIAHKLTAPAHITTGYLDGDRCFFLVYSLDHRARVATSAVHCITADITADESKRLVPSQVARPILSRDPATASLRHDHAPCIDNIQRNYKQNIRRISRRSPEALVVTCYNPVTQQTCAKEVKESEFRGRLLEAETATVGGAILLYSNPIDREEIGRLARLKRVAQSDLILRFSHQTRDHWEPVFEENSFKDMLHTARRLESDCFVLWTKAVVMAAESADRCELARSRFEMASMIFEEALLRWHSSQPPL